MRSRSDTAAKAALLGALRDQHSVNDMHDAVRRVVVSGDHLGVVVVRVRVALDNNNVHLAALDLHLELKAVHRLDLLVILQVRGVDGARDDVQPEHHLELRDVRRLEEMLQDVGGELGKRVVVRCEDSERARRGEEDSEVRRDDGGDEGGEGWD